MQCCIFFHSDGLLEGEESCLPHAVAVHIPKLHCLGHTQGIVQHHVFQIIVYEKTHFGGWSKEFSENISSVPALFGSEEEFREIGSIRVIGGV